LCDGIVKGLTRPDWPEDPWDALRRLALMTLHFTRGRPAGRDAATPALVLSA
jgi:DNA polymerase-3 subunit delta